jgi:23S rRNA (pseudouridine1915-N3)-methyltransferase
MFAEAYNHYAKQIPGLEVVEIKEVNRPDSVMLETKQLIKLLKPEDYNIGLFIDGIQMSSEDLSQTIKDNIQKHFTFIIGGSKGMDNSIKEHCNLCLSLSKLTFTHQFARILIVEQIYRALSILNKGVYHK